MVNICPVKWLKIVKEFQELVRNLKGDGVALAFMAGRKRIMLGVLLSRSWGRRRPCRL